MAVCEVVLPTVIDLLRQVAPSLEKEPQPSKARLQKAAARAVVVSRSRSEVSPTQISASPSAPDLLLICSRTPAVLPDIRERRRRAGRGGRAQRRQEDDM